VMYGMTNDFGKLINANPGYSQIPNFIYALDLSKHPLLVFPYLIRCGNREKGGTCFPSIKTIAKNCSIPSETTVREAIKELIRRGLITKDTTGRHNIYKIDDCIYLAIDKANKKDKGINELEAIPTYSGAIESEEKGVLPIPSHRDGTPPLCVAISSYSGGVRQHIVMPNKTKGKRFKKKTKEEEENSKRQKEVCNIPSRGNITTFLTEVNEYYYNLTDEEKKNFESAARKLVRTGEPDPRNSLVTQRTVRRRFYELLIGLNKWKKSMPKLVGDEPFYLPMQTLKSEHEYVDALSHTVETKEVAL